MSTTRAELDPLELLTDRWLIEALRQMSSNPHVRDAAAAWLDAYRAGLRCGLAEDAAQTMADQALQRASSQTRHSQTD